MTTTGSRLELWTKVMMCTLRLGELHMLWEAHYELGLEDMSGTASISLEQCFELEVRQPETDCNRLHVKRQV